MGEAPMTPQRLDEILAKVPRLKIAVVGDVFLDKYLDIDRRLAEVSLETGREAHQVVDIRCYPGAGGTVAQNLASLGVGRVPAITVIGADGEGHDLKAAMQRCGIDASLVVESPDRRTCTYTKPMLAEPQKPPCELERFDIKNRTPLPRQIEDQLMEVITGRIDELDGVIVADQVQERNCGVITDRVREFLGGLAARHSGKVFFADSRCRIGEFRNMILKPNRAELAEAVSTRGTAASSNAGVASRDDIVRAGRKLVCRTGRPVVVTLGADGLLVVEEGADRLVPGYRASGPIDIVGAGDSVTAGAVTALCAGATLADAAVVGNLVASITIQQIGVTGTATMQQLRDRLVEYNRQHGL
jgi:rfaE bifunctional protein kinase chain/domain